MKGKGKMKKIMAYLLTFLMAFSVVPNSSLVASAAPGDAEFTVCDAVIPVSIATGIGETELLSYTDAKVVDGGSTAGWASGRIHVDNDILDLIHTTSSTYTQTDCGIAGTMSLFKPELTSYTMKYDYKLDNGKQGETTAIVYVRSKGQKQNADGHNITLGCNDVLVPLEVYITLTEGLPENDECLALQEVIKDLAKAVVLDDGKKVAYSELYIEGMSEILKNRDEVISGAKANQTNCNLRYIVNGTSVTVPFMVAVGNGDYASDKPLSSAKLSTSTPKVGSPISVTEIKDVLGDNVPVNNTNADYQWQKFNGTTWENIPGATSSTYTPTSADKDNNIRCLITGKGDYSGLVYAETTDASVSDGTTPGVGPVQGGGASTPVITAKDFIIGKNETSASNLASIVTNRADAKESNGRTPDVDPATLNKLKTAQKDTSSTVTFKDNTNGEVVPKHVNATVKDVAGANGTNVVGGNNIQLKLSEIQTKDADALAALIKDRAKAVATSNGVKETNIANIGVNSADITKLKALTGAEYTNATLTYKGANAKINVDVIDDVNVTYPLIDAHDIIMSVADAKKATSDAVKDAADATRKISDSDKGDAKPIEVPAADITSLNKVDGPADVALTLKDNTPTSETPGPAKPKIINASIKDEANKGTGDDGKKVSIGANDITVDLDDIKNLTPAQLTDLLMTEGNPVALIDGESAPDGAITVKDYTTVPTKEAGNGTVTFTCDGVDVTVDVVVNDPVKDPPRVTAGNIIITLDELASDKIKESVVIARANAKYTDKAGWDGDASGVDISDADMRKILGCTYPQEFQITVGNNKGKPSATTKITVTVVDEGGNNVKPTDNPGLGVYVGADNIAIPVSHAANIEANPTAAATLTELKTLTNATATNAGKDVPVANINADASKIKGHKGVYDATFTYNGVDAVAKVTVTDEGTETPKEIICANNFIIGTADKPLLDDPETVKKLADAVAYDPTTLKPIEITGVKIDVPPTGLEEDKPFNVTFSTPDGTAVTVQAKIDPDWKSVGNVDEASKANEGDTPDNNKKGNGPTTVDQPTAVPADKAGYPGIKANDIIMSVDEAQKAKPDDVIDASDAKKKTSPTDPGTDDTLGVDDVDKLNKVTGPTDTPITVTVKDTTPTDPVPSVPVKVTVKDEANRGTGDDGKPVSIGANDIEVDLLDIKDLSVAKLNQLLLDKGNPVAIVDGIPRKVTLKSTSVPEKSKDRVPGMFKATFTCDGMDVTVDVLVNPAPSKVTGGDVIVSLREIANGAVDEKLLLDRSGATYTDDLGVEGPVTIPKNDVEVVKDAYYPQVLKITVQSKDNPEETKTINVTVVDDLGNLGNKIPEIPSVKPSDDIWVGANDIAMPADKVEEIKKSPEKLKDLADAAATDAGNYVPKSDIGADATNVQPVKGVYEVTYTYKGVPVVSTVTVTDTGKVNPNGDTICGNDFIIGTDDFKLITDPDNNGPENVKKLSNAIAYDTETLKPVPIKSVDTSKVKDEPGTYPIKLTTANGTELEVNVTIDKDWKTIANTDDIPKAIDEASKANKGKTPENDKDGTGPTTVKQQYALKNPNKDGDKETIIPIDDIKDALGVDDDTAKKIQEVAKDLDVPLDTLKVTEDTITSQTSDDGMPGSDFGRLKARAIKNLTNQTTIKWTKQKGADGYQIYGNKCNAKGKKYKYQLIKDNVGKTKTSMVMKKLKGKKLEKGTYYKFMVVAYKIIDGRKVTIASSVTCHTTTKGGKYGVAKAVKISKIAGKKVKTTNNVVNYTMKKGKSAKVTADEIREYKNKKIKHHRVIWYESSNPKVAKVNKETGKIKAKSKGSCKIWVYAQNGVYSTIKLKVKE